MNFTMTKLRLFLAASALFSLTACVPKGYVESPTMAAYFKQLLPTLGQDGVETVSICRRSEKWYASVELTDKTFYHYLLTDKDSFTPRLSYRLTDNERKDSDYECIGVRTLRGWYNNGRYRFEIDRNKIQAQVDKEYATYTPFDDSTKTLLKSAALAVEHAVKDRKNFDPVGTSWGVPLIK